MKGIRFSKAERELLEVMLAAATDWTWHTPDAVRLGDSMLEKVRAAVSAPAGVAVKPIEDALIKSSHGKVVALEGGHARASRTLTSLSATVEQAELIGAYMARSTWLTSPMTVLDVANKWNSWLPKARATAPPPALQPGFDGATEKGSGVSRSRGQVQRPAPGFGRSRTDSH